MKDGRVYSLISKGFGSGINYSEITLEDFLFLSTYFGMKIDQKKKKVFLKMIEEKQKEKVR